MIFIRSDTSGQASLDLKTGNTNPSGLLSTCVGVFVTGLPRTHSSHSSCFRIKKKLRGRVSGDLMHAVDWYNTILGMTEPEHGEEARDAGDQGEAGDGHNMWPTITSAQPGPRTELVYNINDALR